MSVQASAPSRLAEVLLAPRSIAILGASDDPGKTASRPLRYLRQGGYAGRVYPVARRETVMGERAWPGLDALPERPDHAFVLLGTDASIQAVEDCVRLGVPVVTVLAGGFAEAGADGVERQERLRRMVAGSGTRLLGPNSIGLANLNRNLVLTANAAFAEPGLKAGGIFVASQSGSMIGAILSRGAAKGLGFASLVSVGGEADLGVGEICEAALDDPQVTSYLLFLETIRDGAALRRFAIGAAARGKPVVAYKLGRSEAAAELAVSHTGALAGEDDVASAFLRDIGIARVDTLEGLIEAPALLRRLPIRPASARKPVVGIVTTTGGGAAMVVDQLGLRGIEVRGPGPETAKRLAEAGIDAGHGRILDLTLSGTRPEVMGAALTAMMAADFDLVVAVVGSSARFHPELAVAPITDVAAQRAPLAAFLVPDASTALGLLCDADIPAFRTPEACADAIAAAFARRPPAAAATISAPDRGTPTGPERMLDEAQAYALLGELGVPHAPFLALSAAKAGVADLPFDFPVAVKILHAEIAHKSDVGGVVLGVQTAQALAEAAGRIVGEVARHRPDLEPGRLLVQAMRCGLGEVLLGFRIDPQVGPIVMLAAGGVLAELYRDRSIRLAPVSLATAREMIAEVTALRALEGFRGRTRGDIEALAQAIVSLSRLTARADVVECEINPLLVLPDGEGVMAVDALVRLSGSDR